MFFFFLFLSLVFLSIFLWGRVFFGVFFCLILFVFCFFIFVFVFFCLIFLGFFFYLLKITAPQSPEFSFVGPQAKKRDGRYGSVCSKKGFLR